MRATWVFFLLLYNILIFSNEVTRTYDLNSIREFVYGGGGKIEIKQTGRNRLTLAGKASLLNNTLLTNQRGILSLTPKDHSSEIIEGILEVIDLNKITLSGNVAVDIDMLKGNELIIELLAEGSPLLEGCLEFRKLSLKIEGSAHAILKGKGESQSVYITGEGNYVGRDFITKTSTAHIQQRGTASVNASDKLNASVIGYGQIHYMGNPKINKQLSGEGKILPYLGGMKR